MSATPEPASLAAASLGILLVEDEEDDRFFFERAYKTSGLPYPLKMVPDGEGGIKYLSGVDEFGDRRQFPMPKLVVTDLKMPGVTGFDLLKWMRSEPGLQSIPVLVLTSSNRPEDREKAFALGATEYLVKGGGKEYMARICAALSRFMQASQIKGATE